MSDPAFILVVALLGTAAFVQSATGFGLAIVSMAGLPLVLSIRDATTVTAMLNLIVCVGIVYRNRKEFRLENCWPLIIAICVGIPIGYYGLRTFNDVWVVRTLGIVLILISISELFFRKDGMKMPAAAGVPICCLGGILGGAFNVGGPPIVAYIYSQNWGKVQTVTTLQIIFFASGIVRNGLMIFEGDTTWSLLKLVAISIPAVFVGIWLGKIVLDRTPLHWLKRVVFVAVLVIGTYYLWGSMQK